MRLPRLTSAFSAKHLGWEIALAIAVKLLVLYGLWYACFSQPTIQSMTQGMDPGRVAAAIVAPPANNQ